MCYLFAISLISIGPAGIKSMCQFYDDSCTTLSDLEKYRSTTNASSTVDTADGNCSADDALFRQDRHLRTDRQGTTTIQKPKIDDEVGMMLEKVVSLAHDFQVSLDNGLTFSAFITVEARIILSVHSYRSVSRPIYYRKFVAWTMKQLRKRNI